MTIADLTRRVAPEDTALVVIDVQNDFCAEGGFFDKIGHDLTAIHAAVERLERFIDSARDVGMSPIFVRGIYDRDYLSEAMIERHARMGYPLEHCLSGSWGADFYRVEPRSTEQIVAKHRYSALVDTDLAAILRARKVSNVMLAGVATNVCVESTARDAYMRDYHVVLLTDCSATYSQELHMATIENIRRSFGIPMTGDEVVELWERGRATLAPDTASA